MQTSSTSRPQAYDLPAADSRLKLVQGQHVSDTVSQCSVQHLDPGAQTNHQLQVDPHMSPHEDHDILVRNISSIDVM